MEETYVLSRTQNENTDTLSLYDKRFVAILSRQQSRVRHVSITCTVEIRNFLSANQIELESRRGFFKLGFKLGLDPFPRGRLRG